MSQNHNVQKDAKPVSKTSEKIKKNLIEGTYSESLHIQIKIKISEQHGAKLGVFI